jgi:hypothetical protein
MSKLKKSRPEGRGLYPMAVVVLAPVGAPAAILEGIGGRGEIVPLAAACLSSPSWATCPGVETRL